MTHRRQHPFHSHCFLAHCRPTSRVGTGTTTAVQLPSRRAVVIRHWHHHRYLAARPLRYLAPLSFGAAPPPLSSYSTVAPDYRGSRSGCRGAKSTASPHRPAISSTVPLLPCHHRALTAKAPNPPSPYVDRPHPPLAALVDTGGGFTHPLRAEMGSAGLFGLTPAIPVRSQ
uniref:Uncharacterized protein n=1 Tax=Oryza punctata TaxID=4537 RepID=A0A0E0KEE8_ORYPU